MDMPHNDITELQFSGAAKLLAWEDASEQKREEVLDCWLCYAAKGQTPVDIARQRAFEGKRLLSPAEIQRNIEVAAAWKKVPTAAAAEVIHYKVVRVQRFLMEEFDRISGQMQATDGRGIPRKTRKTRKFPVSDEVPLGGPDNAENSMAIASVEEVEEFVQPTAQIVALSNAFAKLVQVEAVAVGVGRAMKDVPDLTSISINLPGFAEGMFTEPPTIDAEAKPSENGKKGNDGKGNGTKPGGSNGTKGNGTGK